MKTNKLLKVIAIVLLFTIKSINAQTPYYYYYEGEKQYLTLDTTKLNIKVLGEVPLGQSYIKSYKNLQKNLIRIELKTEKQSYIQIVNELRKQSNIITVNPNYITPYNDTLGMSSRFYIRLKQADDYQLLVNLAKQKNVKIVRQDPYMPLWFYLDCTKNTLDNTMNTANSFYETGIFSAVELGFLNSAKLDSSNGLSDTPPPCVNDPDFSTQWALHNTDTWGNSISINACPAWDISKGAGVKIAIVDDGVDMWTTDLIPNLYPIMCAADIDSDTILLTRRQ